MPDPCSNVNGVVTVEADAGVCRVAQSHDMSRDEVMAPAPEVPGDLDR